MSVYKDALSKRDKWVARARMYHQSVMQLLRLGLLEEAEYARLARKNAMKAARDIDDLMARIILLEDEADADRKRIMEELEIERHFCDTYRNLAQEAVHHPYRYAWKHFIKGKGLPK